MATVQSTALPLPIAGNRFVNAFRRLKIDRHLVRNFDSLDQADRDDLRQQYLAAGGDDDEFTETVAMMRDE